MSENQEVLYDLKDKVATIALGLLRDEVLRHQVGEEARRDAVERFGARCVLKQYLALYDQVVGAGDRVDSGDAAPSGSTDDG